MLYDQFYHSRVLNNIDAILAMERIWNYTDRQLCLKKRELNMTDADIWKTTTAVLPLDGPPNVFKEMFKKNLRDGVFCGFAVSDAVRVYLQLILLMVLIFPKISKFLKQKNLILIFLCSIFF